MQLDTLTDEDGRLAALGRYGVLDTAPEHAFDKITTMVKSVLNVPICAVSLIAKDRQWFKAIQGLTVRQTTRDVAFCDHTIRDRTALIVEDATLDSRFADNPLVLGEPHIRSYAGVPLKTPDGFNLGALCVIDTKPRRFDAEQIVLLGQFADLVVRELGARSAPLRDSLTGVLTHEGVIEAVRSRFDLSRDGGSACAVAMFDIDHFGMVNDREGRTVGDAIMKQIAECLGRSLRRDDILGRLEGDTFAIVLAGVTGYEALACAERMRHRVAQLTFAGSPDLRVTVSGGVAALQRGDSENLWLAGAAGALFTAKQSGRNQCVSTDALK